MSEGEESARLDKWLWAVRIFKTRALAAKIISGKSPRIARNGQTLRTDKPGFKLRIGDQVTVMRGKELFVLEVLDLPGRRVSAPEAQSCYINHAEGEESHARPSTEQPTR
ncbi:RNA-binding S4 domain-containing protein [Parvularcula maris]|uniref:RNA-binding S4 domain-containing protein n=1 Tax=Parvularcula maris TaxID=2965077 RepID=A0A9X2L924_9PROT|nr:RNA-binding S4 domain-containing protein [Parvularcula maris]MCQ8185360.1 RNA-binding S4 domain-containing protein [Parvularcula maris]